jgi:N4-gp56 family major capsid protein
MSLTTVPVGDPTAISKQSAGLFIARTQPLNNIGKLAGELPKFNAAMRDKKQMSSKSLPLVRCMELTKEAGDEIKIDLALPVTGKPYMGAEMIEGKGAAMETETMSMRVNQTRKPISGGDTMSQQRTIYDLRERARTEGFVYMRALADQKITVHAAGARGHLDNRLWHVPLASDSDFSKIMVNAVKAPTRNRHLVADATNGLDDAYGAMSGTSFASGDEMTIATIDALRAYVDNMPFPPAPVIIPGDQAAYDSPLRLLMVSPAQYESIKTDSTAFRTFQANAYARASSSKHPLFMGDVGIWNGFLVRVMPFPVRFTTNGTVKYCAAYTTETESDYTATFTFDRALVLGGNAIVEAFGGYKTPGKSGPEMFRYTEKMLDHDDKYEVALAEISGVSKVRYQFDHGDGNGNAYTDLNILALDTAVTVI